MSLIQELLKLQHDRGYLTPDALRQLADRLHEPLYRIEELVSFFPHFRADKPRAFELDICQSMTCALRDGRDLIRAANSKIEQLRAEGRLDPDTQIRVRGVQCLGQCDHAPAALLHRYDEHGHEIGHEGTLYPRLDPKMVAEIIRAARKKIDPPPAPPAITSPSASTWTIDPYQGQPESQRYQTIRNFFKRVERRRLGLEAPGTESSAEGFGIHTLAQRAALQQAALKDVRNEIIEALKKAELLGMGGAGGRAFKKWSEVLREPGPVKYVVCNGDESEPGTFKDRELFMHAPHLVVEAMILGALVVGAQHGYIYVRHEFEPQIARLKEEVARAKDLGVCGPNILGLGVDFELEVFTSPGGYICGEQTALIEVIQDNRSEPRNKPPELQTNGLRNKPTLLHNVETLAWVPSIVLRDSGQWFADQGRPGFKGRRFFSISGDLERPGVYEVPNGCTLGELIKMAGGIKDGRPIRALALSGPSGGFLPRLLPRSELKSRYVEKLPPGSDTYDLLDMQLDINRSREMGVMLGAGMVVYATGTDIVRQAMVCSEFFRDESCGKCVPCRLGSKQMAHWARMLAKKRLTWEEYGDIQEQIASISEVMQVSSICGLGTVAYKPLVTLFKFFPDDVEAQLIGKAPV